VLGTACTPESRTDSSRSLRGERLEVMGAWSGAEAGRFRAVLRRFAAATAVEVTYTSAGRRGVPDVLSDRLGAGRPPDVALLPQPGLLRRLAAAGEVTVLDRSTARRLRRNYSSEWRRLGSYDGQPYGVWFKAANKSLVWYGIAAFERAGVVPPTTLGGLRAVARALTSAGSPAWAVPAASGWTLTDWFENLLLCRSGPDIYDQVSEHRIPWTHPAVTDALREMVRILRPAELAGDVAQATRTDFADAVQQVFDRPPAAAMVMEADFVAGVISAETDAEVGVDADAFPFPCGRGPTPRVVGGGDLAVALRDSPAAQRLLRYLATPVAARVWASRGGFLTPNLQLDLAVYPDDLTRSMARHLIDAGDDFRFDLSDLQPPAFGGSERTGMQPLLRSLLRNRDVTGTASRLEAAAASAFAAAPADFSPAG
jgi:alpha-glucoside transport system substrate-binding protein